MARPRRLVLGGLLLLGAVLLVALARIGWEWKQALDNVDAMIVTPIALPTASAGQDEPGDRPRLETPGTDSGSAHASQPTPVPTAVPEPDGPMNILLMGTDARPGEDISRTDAMILIHIDPRSGRVGMLSFPRDLWVTIPGHGKARINTAYTIGEQKIGPGYGPALAKATVSRLTGLPIQHFVLINFEGFRAVIDKIGGIYVDVPRPIDDPAYPTDDYGTIAVHFDAGRQLMDGERALIYARTRHADSDFGRNQRQQQVLMAIFDRVREQNLLAQLTNLDDYTGALRDYVRTDLSRSEMLSLASLGARLNADDIRRYAIEPKMVVAQQNPYILLLKDPQSIKRLVNQMIGDSLAAAGGEASAPDRSEHND